APEKRDIAMVFQNYALYPHMTVAENLAFPLRAPARRVDPAAIAARVAQAAETLGIAPLLARYPREISGGQQQRVALGRAMIRDPGVFLLDEPLSNLDARLRLRMRHDLKALHQRLRSTVVYVTHDQSEAMSLSDRIAIYHAGRLQQFAAPIDIYRRPVNLFVANFMGEREMNTVEGDVIEADGAIRLAAGGASLRLGDADSAWRRLAGRRVVFGIRPEGVTIVGHGSGDAAPLAGRLRVVEHAGAEQVFFAETPLGEFCGRAAADAGLQVGDAVALDLAAGERFVFDAASGRAEVHGGRPGSGPPAAARS
ncbi:MAG: ABC transporter ATP-binding protein, partial [Lautropia sp.]